MHDGTAREQVGADREERARQLFDLELPEDAFQHPPGFAGPDQCHARHRPVVKRRLAHELLVAAISDLIGLEAEGRHRRDERAHAAAAEPVDLMAGFDDRGDRADVGEATSAAAREHETERPAGDPSGHARRAKVVRRLVDKMVGRGLGLLEPERRPAGRHRREQDKVAAGCRVGDCCLRSGQEDGAIALPAAERVPVRVRAPGHEQDEVVRGLRSRQ